MTGVQSTLAGGDYGPPRLSIELTNICNLHCSYCLRDEDALYHTKANYFPLPLLKRIIGEARETFPLQLLTFTGGEPTLHPGFSEILDTARDHGLKVSFVTNGWNFEKLWPTLLKARDTIGHISFSLDGITVEEHDHWRGAGSFVRLVGAFSRCYRAGLPFTIKVGLRRDTVEKLESIAMFAARVGAARLSFSHLLPTSSVMDDEHALSLSERTLAEQEIAALSRIFKMPITLDVGYYNIGPAEPCSPLKGTSANIDYRGRLTLCCNLSGFRGAALEEDVIADLNTESFATAHSRLREVARLQMERRAQALEAFKAQEQTPDLYTGSPCLHCLQSFGKIPWHDSAVNSAKSPDRSLPVVNTTSANV